MKTVGETIRDIRKAKKLSLGEVANGVDGYDAGNLSRFERGVQGIATDKLEKVCQVLNTTVSHVYSIVEGLEYNTQPKKQQKVAEEVTQYENIKDFQKYVDSLKTTKEIDQVHELLSHFVVLPEQYKQEVLAIVNRIYQLETGLKQVARRHGRKPEGWENDAQQQQDKDTKTN